jgi:MATE family multidrug resistance protein
MDGDAPERKTHRRILAIALPMIVSNLSVPLLGIVDTAVIGHLKSPVYLAAVAVGATIFSFLFLGLNFLRMTTTGVTAQARGRDDHAGVRRALVQSLLVALGLAFLLITLQWPLEQAALAILGPAADVRPAAGTYFLIRIWAAPAVLLNYALIGWFLGLGNARAPLAVMVAMAAINIGLDAGFVLGLGWKVAGVATGTLIAEYLGAALSIVIATRMLKGYPGRWRGLRIMDRASLARLVSLNGNIFLRSLALMFVFGFVTAAGARLGTVILAANALLLNFQNVLSYALDGFAHAAEALCGHAIGAADREQFDRVVRAALLWSLALAGLFTLVWWLAGPALIALLTDLPDVRATAARFLPWIVVLPLVAVWAFLLDGIYIGATRARAMRNAMLFSAFACFLPVWCGTRALGNHGLWLAFVVFFAARGISMAAGFPRLRRAAFCFSGNTVGRTQKP